MAFATADDVSTRLMRPLTQAEVDAAELLLDGVASEIAGIADTTIEDLEDDVEDATGILKFISIDAVCRVLGNPTDAAQINESLGAYQYMQRFREQDKRVLLTTAERRSVRRALSQSFTSQTLASPYSGDDSSDSIADNDLIL